jgi:flagellar protein FlaI
MAFSIKDIFKKYRYRYNYKDNYKNKQNIFKQSETETSSIHLEVPVKYRSNIIERYPINEPYAEIAIVYDPDSYEKLYLVLEPLLSDSEKTLLKEMKNYLLKKIDPSKISSFEISSLETSIEKLNLNLNKNNYKKEEILKIGVNDFLSDYEINLDAQTMEKLFYYIKRDFLGFWKIDAILRDPIVEDISGDGPNIPIYIYHRKYGSIKTNVVFIGEEADSIVQILALKSGKHISLSNPLLDATLPDGSRLQASLGSEVTTTGSTFTIRKFRADPITFIDLIDFGTFSPEIIAYLWLAVENGKSIIFAGGTASGKTTALNAICLFIPPESKIVSIEDTREIQLYHENWIPAITLEREEGGKSIDTYELLKAALRQRPEYLIVGEVRGKEAYTLFQAMATGHITYSTIHADSAEAVVRRLLNPPIEVPLLLMEGLDIICVLGMVKVGTKKLRRCRQIVEVTGLDLENKKLILNEIFAWKPLTDSFEFTGESKIFTEIVEASNISPEQLSEEFKKRVKILEYLKERKKRSIKEVSSVVMEYYQNPMKFMERINIGEI